MNHTYTDFSHRVNQVLHRVGLHITKDADPGRYSWIIRNVASAPSLLRWVAPEIIRQHGLKTFVQVGANDGEADDPAQKCVEQFSLQGVMVEPQPRACQLLRRKYAGVERITIDQVAVSDTEGSLTLYHFESDQVTTRAAKPVKADLFSSGDRHHMERIRDTLGQTGDIKEMKVPALTWKGLLHKHQLPYPDIVVVDTESMDDVIVNQIELGEQGPALIQFEHLCLNSSRLNPCTERLFEAGYRFMVSENDVLCMHQRIWRT